MSQTIERPEIRSTPEKGVEPRREYAARKPGILTRAARGVPTLLAVALLAGLGYAGHRTGWKLPSFASLTGEAEVAATDWCDAHSVPESICVECNPAVMAPGKDHGWCREHGVHQCPLCHPESAQLTSPAAVTPDDLERVRQALELKERPANNSRCPLYRRRIQLASIEAMERAGVDVALAEQQPVVEAVSANGEIAYDPTRVAHLASRVGGAIVRVEKQVGDAVRAGEVLAVVDAAEVGRVKADLLQAHAQVRYKGKVIEGMRATRGAIPDRVIQGEEAELRQAETRLQAARQALVNLGLPITRAEVMRLDTDALTERLQLLGLPEAVTQDLDPATTSSNLLPLRAPFDGIVVERHASLGEVVDTSRDLFVTADTRQMWLLLAVRQEDVRHVRPGQVTHFTEDRGELSATGKVSWVSTRADEKTRTVQVRVELANPEGRLRAGTFGTGRIVLREDSKAVVVPTEAVQWDGSCHVVFVRDRRFFEEGSPKVFHTRTVRPGVVQGKVTEIIAGLLPGEVVASKGSGVLRGELLKNNLGEG